MKAVLFDLYGTLLVYGNMGRAFHSWHREIEHFVRKNGREKTLQEIQTLCVDFFSIQTEIRAGFSLYEERLNVIFRRMGLEISEDNLHQFANGSMNSWQREIHLHPEGKELLETLKKRNIKTGIISNFDHSPHVRKVLRDENIESLLDEIILSGEVHLKKPDKKIFLLAAHRLSLSPEEILFVGDDPKEDREGARAAGMKTFLCKNGKSLLPILKMF